MPRTFSQYVAAGKPATPSLPVAHTTDGYYLGRIVRSCSIEPTDCPVYKESLAYYFYGRPAYRALQSTGPTSLNCTSAVSFLIDGNHLPAIKRLLPFDSGAMHTGRFKDFLHPRMELKDFEATPSIIEAGKLVDMFFGDNKNYYMGAAKPNIAFGPLDAEVECYCSLIATRSVTVADDRRSSIELQISAPLILNPPAVLAVIVPESFADDADIVDFATNVMKAEIVTYGLYHAPPSHDTRAILDVARTYIDRKGYLK